MIPAIGITLGDPGGIGPEIALKALSGKYPVPEARYVVCGSGAVLSKAGSSVGTGLKIESWDKDSPPERPGLYLEDIGLHPGEPVMGASSPENGRFSFECFRSAVDDARAGKLNAIVTAPVSKISWRMAGLPWKGHTEYLESIYPEAIMTFWSERLRVALLSHHLPLREALVRIKKQRLQDFLRNLHGSLARVRSGVREILVAGLNPHAGEDGLLGSEEKTEIIPAVEAARREGIPVSGPFPPDTVFLRALGRQDKMVAALYHDQGLIGFKMEAFAVGVNATLGMPFVRTSPDHGTAFDIAGKGVADPGSMVEAVRLAAKLA
jgi:4-hydroxythreonine-4-phosphate dehydrogenase